jgi:aldehyde:ferredoxin oxidoreductase
MANGYMGKILWVDLTKGTLKDEALGEKLCRNYIGGYGLGAKIIFDRQKAGVDPLGSEAIFGLVTGPYSGTQALGSSRYIVVGKSPLTGTWGDANSGGYVGPYLKFAGYDAVFFTGQSARPVYLLIDNGKAELKDAAKLWGKDTFEVEDIVKAEYGNDAEVACIGPSGEKLSLIAAVMNNKGRAAGRSGLGAVMGSKKLKALVVKGKMKVPLFDEKKVADLRKKYTGELGGPIGLFREFGTAGIAAMSMKSGDAPVKNWSGVGVIDFPNPDKISGGSVTDFQTKKYSCYRCVVGCGGHMKQGAGEYQYEEGAHKPEYETLAMFGSNCLNDNLDSIIKANDICNRYGLDTISAGACMAFAIECYENGIISKQDTGGIEMTWGNHKSIIAMLEKLARREGFGDTLANGVKLASEKIGKGADKYAMHLHGEEFPAHDPKLGYSFAAAYRLDATPARHTRGGGMNPPGLPMPEFDRKAWTGRGEAQKIGMNYNHVVDSIGCCSFVFGTYPNASVLIEFLNAITGWKLTMEETLKAGERIANIRHAFNLREGLNPLTYKNPDRMAGIPPFKEGPLAGKTVPEETIEKEYCEAMDWDHKTAKPSKKKLAELDMDDVAKVLYP